MYGGKDPSRLEIRLRNVRPTQVKNIYTKAYERGPEKWRSMPHFSKRRHNIINVSSTKL